jgi:DNA polymerase I
MTDTVAPKRKKLAIIDGNSVFYRGYYAMPYLSTKDGRPTGGVYGFAVLGLELLKRFQPDYVCVAWDKKGTSTKKRKAIYPEYKAGRKTPPPDFFEQIPILHELLGAFNWPLYEIDDYEADDILGTLSRQANEQDVEVMLISSDLDMLQLIGPMTHMYALKKGFSNIELFHPESFEEKYGIEVEQFVDLKALKGDASDNLPGVPGIGEKGAIKLLQEYKTLDGIYDNVELISGATHKKLIEGKDSAYMTRELGKIWCDAPVTLDLEAMDTKHIDAKSLHDMLQQLEFRSLVRQLPDVMQLSPEQQAESDDVTLSKPKVHLIDNWDDLQNITIPKSGHAVLNAYLFGKHGRNPKYITVAFKQTALYMIDCEAISDKHLVDFFEGLIHLTLVGYDIKASIKVLYELGLEAGAVEHDVLIGSFLINSLRREQSLTELARADLGYEGADLDHISADEYAQRIGTIIAVIWKLYEQQAKQLQDLPKVQELARDIEWPVIPVLAAMEHRGILLNTEYLRAFAEELTDSISDLEQEIYGHANQEFNIGSPQQLAIILFDKLGLPTQGVKKGKTGYSTAANELIKLRTLHPIIDLISQYREASKLMSTYVEALPKQVDDESRLHTTFNLTIAQTGRLSSIDPNLQNIPVRTELGNRIRTAFGSKPGYSLVSVDYSQFELRLAAVLANDTELIDMFNRGTDIHTATAAQVYGRNVEDVTKQMRRDAKVINFGVLYGMSPHGLSAATGMTFVAAKQFIDKYFELRKPILEYMNSLKEQARKEGYVETMFGRRRPMPDIHSSNFIVRQAAERAAINMPIQGTEADLMKLAMTKVDEHLKTRKQCYMLLQIHDSILIECPTDQAKDVAKEVSDIMEAVYKLPVNLTVDAKIGENWGEL